MCGTRWCGRRQNSYDTNDVSRECVSTNGQETVLTVKRLLQTRESLPEMSIIKSEFVSATQLEWIRAKFQISFIITSTLDEVLFDMKESYLMMIFFI